MKTIKILLPAAALFVSALAFGQKTNSTHSKKYENRTGNPTEARVNGAVNANAHANENAQRNANENSVLNGSTSVKTKYKARVNRSDSDKRKYVKKRKG